MLLLVRTRDQLKKSMDAFTKAGIKNAGFSISRLNYHKLELKGGEEGIILTSPNAALAVPPCRLPFYCVGEKTAAEAKGLGHRVIFDGAGGSGEDMAKAMLERYPVQKLVHAAGDTAREGWYDLLTDAGYSIEKRVVYSTEYVTDMDPENKKMLLSGQITHVALFSVNGAEEFAKVCQNAKIDLSKVKAIAFSPQIAEKCVGFGAVLVCEFPSLEAVKQCMAQ